MFIRTTQTLCRPLRTGISPHSFSLVFSFSLFTALQRLRLLDPKVGNTENFVFKSTLVFPVFPVGRVREVTCIRGVEAMVVFVLSEDVV